MRTVIYQSFRTHNVPEWISRCMESTKVWARLHNFDYRFWDDSFFDFVPTELQPRARTHICLLSDYARLIAAKKLLEEGYDRAIWVDADAVIFDPENFKIPITTGYAFCREIWHDLTFLSRPYFKLSVNNSVSVFCRDQDILDTYIQAAREIFESNQTLEACSIGTYWLLQERARKSFHLLDNVGIFGPEMMYRYLIDDARFLTTYLHYQSAPIQILNLCNSKLGQTHVFGKDHLKIDNSTLCQIIERLHSDKGASLNQHFRATYHPSPSEFSRPLSYFQSAVRRIQYSRPVQLFIGKKK